MSIPSVRTTCDPPVTLLDLLESTDYPDPASTSSLNATLPYLKSFAFRHSGWKDDRRRVWYALRATTVSRSRLIAFTLCGARCWVLRAKADSTKLRFAPDHCHDRFCVPCARARASVIRKNLIGHLKDPPYRLLTLTMRATMDGLSERINSLLRAFRRLRGRVLWKQGVTGGAAFLEVTRGRLGDHWHVHLHAIIDGKYIPQPLLSRTWLDITGDSKVVDIRLVRSADGALRYITKYVTKSLPSDVLRNPDHLLHAMKALEGRKLLYAFGTWHKLRLLHSKSDDDWESLGHINDFLYGPQHDEHLSDAVRLAYQAYVNVCDGGEFCVLPDPDEPRAPPEE